MKLKIKLTLDGGDDYILGGVGRYTLTEPYLCAEGLDEVFKMSTKRDGYYKEATLVISDYLVTGAAPMQFVYGSYVRVLDRPEWDEQYISMHTCPVLESLGINTKGKTYWVWVEL